MNIKYRLTQILINIFVNLWCRKGVVPTVFIIMSSPFQKSLIIHLLFSTFSDLMRDTK